MARTGLSRLLLFAAACCPSLAYPTERLAVLDHRRLPEASGMVVAGHDPERLWFINDSGNRPELIALDLGSGKYERLRVAGSKNRDWEDLAAFRYDNEPWLAIGDIGDNAGRRGHIKVYLLPEPADPSVREAKVHTTLELEYPKKARDAESLAIDSRTQTLYLMSKRERRPRLFRVALPELKEGAEHKLTLSNMGRLKSIPAPSEDELARPYGKFAAQPTAMTFMEQQQRIAVLTYRGVYVADLDDSGDWLAALNERLCPLAMPVLKQAEAIAGDTQGRIYVTSEGKNAPVYRLEAPSCDL
ncbi:MAG: SdiA-regulated domain-containing protein [Pseudomonadota bacterium]